MNQIIFHHSFSSKNLVLIQNDATSDFQYIIAYKVYDIHISLITLTLGLWFKFTIFETKLAVSISLLFFVYNKSRCWDFSYIMFRSIVRDSAWILQHRLSIKFSLSYNMWYKFFREFPTRLKDFFLQDMWNTEKKTFTFQM